MSGYDTEGKYKSIFFNDNNNNSNNINYGLLDNIVANQSY